MKHLFKSLATLALVSLTFLSCSDEKETALNISDIKGSATVKGKVEYDAGINMNGDNRVTYLAPVSGKRVYFYLEIESLLGEKNVGKLTYSTTTNSDGEFSITLPATADGIKYSVSLESFEVSRYVANTGSNSSEMPYIQKNFFYQTPQLTGTITLIENLDVYRYAALSNPTEIQ